MRCIQPQSALLAALLGLVLVGCAVEDYSSDDTDWLDIVLPITNPTTPRPNGHKWACAMDFAEMADDGYDNAEYTTDEFVFSNDVTVTTPYAMYASASCLDVTNPTGNVGLCIKGRNSNGDPDDGRVTIMTPGTFTGFVVKTCDHDKDVMVTVDGDRAYDYLPGAGENHCANKVTKASFLESTGTTMRALQNVLENPEAFVVDELRFTGKACK